MKKKNVQLVFDETMLELFEEMRKILNEYGLWRINSIVLLKGLLEEKNSILYNFLCATSANNPYKQIINDCNDILGNVEEKEKAIRDEEDTFRLQIVGEQENKEVGANELYLNKEVMTILSNTFQKLSEEYEGNEAIVDNITIEMDTEDLFITLIYDMPKSILNILKDNGVDIEAIKEYYELLAETYDEIYESEYTPSDILEPNIPKALSSFVTNISEKYKSAKESEILGRDNECTKVMRILQKRGKKNAILIGEPGVGKTSIAERIAFDIATGNCPDELKGHIVLSLNINSAIAGAMYRGDTEKRFKDLVDFLEKHENIILFLDEIHMVFNAGAITKEDSSNMANALKPFLASPKAKVVGATTKEEYERYFAKDGAFKRRFEKVIVKEPKSTEVYDMLKNAIKANEKFHGVKISKKMVEYAIFISSCFNNNTRNPDRTNDLIDMAMVIAKEKGKKSVDKESILENFEIEFKKFQMMEESEKMATAYHEAGHYIIIKKSEKLINYDGIAVSIMPAEDYLGITVWDDLSDEVTVRTDREYYIDKIAKLLGGRVAEELYTKTISSGASSDLEKANKLAYDIVALCGMSKDTSNRIYLDDGKYHLMSEKNLEQIDAEVKEMIKEGNDRAKQIISENQDLLLNIVEELMKKGILDKNDLEKICQKTERKKNS